MGSLVFHLLMVARNKSLWLICPCRLIMSQLYLYCCSLVHPRPPKVHPTKIQPKPTQSFHSLEMQQTLMISRWSTQTNPKSSSESSSLLPTWLKTTISTLRCYLDTHRRFRIALLQCRLTLTLISSSNAACIYARSSQIMTFRKSLRRDMMLRTHSSSIVHSCALM